MLLVTADVFSGRPNPTWTLEDESEVRKLLSELSKARDSFAVDAARNDRGLGVRGFFIEPMIDDMARDYALPSSLYVPVTPDAPRSKGQELIERLTALLSKSGRGLGLTDAEAGRDQDLESLLAEQLAGTSRATVTDGGARAPEAGPAEAPADVCCQIELAAYNPQYWNNDPVTLNNNNCYNYASNRKTNTFAQPGRGSGHMCTVMSCPDVTQAALSDGLHRRYDCFPATEKPRYLVALVIWPGRDYHWYRKNREGFWSHKPGRTPARNVDNGGKIIQDPATCDRGPYTQFCGYFYTCKSQKIQ